MTLYAAEILVSPAFGWQGGPEFNTRVVPLKNGHERRNANWEEARHRYILPFKNIKSSDYLAQIKAAFFAMRGQTYSFLVKDHSDYQATMESLGTVPSGTTPIQLTKVSDFNGVITYTRTITKPVLSGFTMYQDAGSGPIAKAGTLNTTTGLFTPTTSWTSGATAYWTGEFRVPVRFATDALPMTIDEKFMGDNTFAMNGSVELVEVFGE
jgi:uncharacterized protein (TIGR02217 family)